MRVGRSWAARGLLVVLVASSSWTGSSAPGLPGGLSVEKRSVERPGRGASGRWRVRAWHQGREREAPLCQLCCASLRVRVKSTGESSPAPRKARAQPRLTELPWGQTSRLAHQGTTRVQVTCNGLVGPFRSPRPHVIKVHGPRLTPLSVRGSLLSFLLNECWWRRL